MVSPNCQVALVFPKFLCFASPGSVLALYHEPDRGQLRGGCKRKAVGVFPELKERAVQKVVEFGYHSAAATIKTAA